MLEPEDIFNVSPDEFERISLEIFARQFHEIAVYREFCNYINRSPQKVTTVEDIPFLPIQFFKSHEIRSIASMPELIFESSGTTGEKTSRHFVQDAGIYRQSFLLGFERIYGNPENYCILGLLPSYLERGNSSLVFMVDELIKKSGHKNSGFYLYEFEKLAGLLSENERSGQKTILIGVTYALLDFFEAFPQKLMHTTIIETGGMKGRKQEMVRAEVHAFLSHQTGAKCIHSEYGMTELLSQAYSTCNGIFTTPAWMRILLRSEDDPLEIIGTKNMVQGGRTGIINVIDLANLNSCAFIATDDLGKLYPNNNFEILGRVDVSDLRGCNLLYADKIK